MLLKQNAFEEVKTRNKDKELDRKYVPYKSSYDLG